MFGRFSQALVERNTCHMVLACAGWALDSRWPVPSRLLTCKPFHRKKNVTPGHAAPGDLRRCAATNAWSCPLGDAPLGVLRRCTAGAAYLRGRSMLGCAHASTQHCTALLFAYKRALCRAPAPSASPHLRSTQRCIRKRARFRSAAAERSDDGHRPARSSRLCDRGYGKARASREHHVI